MIAKNLSNLYIILIGLSLLATVGFVSIGYIPESFSQLEGTEKSTTSQSTVHITKHGSNSYALSKGSSQIGSFHTTYEILGSVSSLKESKDLITSTIVSDYDKSPFIGYVIAHKSKSSDSPGLANPFVDKATINKKITSEIHSSVDSTNKLKTKNAVIKCNFGMEISKWHCSTHGLLG